jgi:hypothetical protein
LSAAASNLIAQASQLEDQDDNNLDEYIDINSLDTEPSTMQLGLRRLNDIPDAYQPGTLPPRLYQSNPFA